jgi:hypothetical protein
MTEFVRHYDFKKISMGVSRLGRRVDVMYAHLVHAVLQDTLLLSAREASVLQDLVFEHKQHDWVLWSAGAAYPVASRIELCFHRFDVLSQSLDDGGVLLEYRDGFGSGGGQECR